MENKNDRFEYSYSANEQKEILKIKEKYTVKEKNTEESSYERLKALDKSATRKPLIIALTLGIIGALVMGTGMSLVMTDLGEMMNINNDLLVGVIVGCVGLVMVVISYPVYLFVYKREKARVAPEILRISEELLN
jgi:hypothetical protein